jgi:hypothetical protein
MVCRLDERLQAFFGSSGRYRCSCTGWTRYPEQLLWVHTFDTVEELRQALQAFRRLYNDSWLVARHGHKTPSQIRAERLAAKEAA